MAETRQHTIHATQNYLEQQRGMPESVSAEGKGRDEGRSLHRRGYDINGSNGCTRHLLLSLKDSLLSPQVPGAPGLKYNFKDSWTIQ